MNRMGAPHGERHGRCKYSDAVVEEARQMHDEGFAIGEIAWLIHAPWMTVRDWVEYRTRRYVTESA